MLIAPSLRGFGNEVSADADSSETLLGRSRTRNDCNPRERRNFVYLDRGRPQVRGVEFEIFDSVNRNRSADLSGALAAVARANFRE